MIRAAIRGNVAHVDPRTGQQQWLPYAQPYNQPFTSRPTSKTSGATSSNSIDRCGPAGQPSAARYLLSLRETAK